MALAKKVCRVCGKTYEACRSAKRNEGVFHWQEVACSPECGAEYLRRVNEARRVHVQETEAPGPDTVLLKEQRPHGKKKERKTVEPPAEELQTDKEALSDSEI